MTCEANVLEKARELMSEFRSLTCRAATEEEHRSFEEFVLAKLAELMLTVESLQRASHAVHQEDYRGAPELGYWTTRANDKFQNRMTESDEWAPDLGGEG